MVPRIELLPVHMDRVSVPPRTGALGRARGSIAAASGPRAKRDKRRGLKVGGLGRNRRGVVTGEIGLLR